MATIQISSYTINPTAQLSADDVLEARGLYTRSFVASDGVTPVAGNDSNGQFGPYYSIDVSLVGGNLVVAAHDVQPTTESNPTGNYIEQLWVNGAYSQTLMPNNNVGTGWAIPTTYGPVIAFDEIATYNRAKRLVYPPKTYFTADDTVLEIRRIAGDFAYAAVGVNGITSLSVPPVVAGEPIAVGDNDPRLVAVPDASALVKGKTRLSLDPVSATAPIAVGDNDTRLISSVAYASLASLTAIAGTIKLLTDRAKGFVYKTASSVWTLLRREINALDFGVLNDGTGQSTANLQAALDAAAASILSKTVWLPPGNYLFTSGTLIVPEGISLVGSWLGDPSHTGVLDVGLHQPDPASNDGTTILIDTGSGTATGSFITLYANASVNGISFYWPSQSQSNVTPTAYPWCITITGQTYTGFNQQVTNCEFVNAYQGIKCEFGGRWKIRNITGQFLKCGLDLDYMFDKSEVYNFKNTLEWSSPFNTAGGIDNAFKWMNANGVGIRVGKVDALTIVSPFIYGSNKGIEFHSSPATVRDGHALPGGVGWVDVIGGGVGDGGVHGLYFSGNAAAVSAQAYESRVKISGVDISSGLSSAGGTTYGVYFASDFIGNVSLATCQLGPFGSDYNIYILGAPILTVASCVFIDWDVAAIFSNYTLGVSPPQLSLAANVFLKINFLTLDFRGTIVGTDSGSLYPTVEATAISNTSTLSFYLNGVRLNDANLTYGLAGSGAKVKVSATGNILLGPAAEVATTATASLLYIPSVNGTPTGAPAASTGMVPFIYDRANRKICVYDGSWRVTAALT